jgi:hypothetical protein
MTYEIPNRIVSARWPACVGGTTHPLGAPSGEALPAASEPIGAAVANWVTRN